MNQALLFILDDDQGAFTSLIRSFFAGIIRFLYNWISKLVDVMYSIASKDLGMGEYVTSIADKIFIALIIFMIFKLTISIMTYLVEPDSFTDGSKGVQGIIKRVIISVVLLISINPIFTILYDLQDVIIKDDIITNLVMGTSKDTIFVTSEGNRAYLTQISPICDDIAPDARVVTFSQGDHLALLTLRPFIQPVEDDGDYEERKEKLKEVKYCGIDITDESEIPYVDTSAAAMATSIAGPHSAGAYMQWKYYNEYTGDWSIENNVYLLDFNYFFALLIGAVVFLILISFCFDVVIRSFTLMLLQVMAPIPIVSYISPKGKSSEMLGIWAKKLMSTWLSLFIKMLALSVALTAIAAICESLSNDNSGFIMQIIVILGALMFAKKLPQLIEELIPGLKLGGFELNPFKRISKDALGGNMMLGAGAAAIAAGMSGAANAITGAEKNLTGENNPGFKWNKGKGLKENLKHNIGATGRLSRGLLKTSGSIIAGQASAGGRAFMKTSKDGKIFTGIKEGHLESQFAKQQRADLQRKGSTLGGRIAADANRWIGRENAAQRQQLEAANQDIMIANQLDELRNEKLIMQRRKSEINEQKIQNQNKKDKATRVYKDLETNFDNINKRIDSQKPVKDEIEKLEWIKNTDFSRELAEFKQTQIENIDKKYSVKLQNAKNNEELEKIRLEREQEKSAVRAIDVTTYKQEKIDAQNTKVNEARKAYFIDNKEKDQVLKAHIDAVEKIKSENAEVAANADFEFIDKDGKYNKGAVYKAKDQVSIISRTYDEKEAGFNNDLYDINIKEQEIAAKERKINEYKQSDEYVNAHNKESKPYADNASRKVAKGGQPEGWTLSGNVNAGGTTGYGGNQYYSNSGNGGPGPGPHGHH